MDASLTFRCSCLIALCLAVSAVVGPRSEAQAEDVRREVLEDCAAAGRSFDQLKPELRNELVPYLSRVIRLQVSPTDVRPSGALLGSPGIDTGLGPEIAFNPGREVAAKQCATELLERIGGPAMPAVAHLVEVSLQPSLPEELRDGMAEAAVQIAIKAAEGAGIVAGEQLIAALTELYLMRDSTVAGNILVELGAQGVQHLQSKIPSVGPAQARRLAELLTRIDPEGTLIGPKLLELFGSEDEEIKLRCAGMLTKLPGFYPQFLPALVESLKRASAVVQAGLIQDLREINGRLSAGAPRPEGPGVVRSIGDALKSVATEQRRVLAQTLAVIGDSSPELVSVGLELSSSKEINLRCHGLLLLGQTKPAPDEAFRSLLEALYDSNLVVVLEAMSALGQQTGRTEAVLSALAKLLKSNRNQKDTVIRQSILLQAANTLEALSAGAKAQAFVPYLIEALEADPLRLGRDQLGFSFDFGGSAAAVVSTLIALGPTSTPALLKVLGSFNPVVRRRAIDCLAQIRPVGRGVVSGIAARLDDSAPEVSAAAKEALAGIGAEAVAELQKVAARGSLGAKVSALEVVQGLVEKFSPPGKLLQEILQSQSCVLRTRGLKLFLPSLEPRAMQDMKSCLLTGDEAVLDELLELKPFPEPLRPAILELVENANDRPAVQLKIIGAAGELGFSAEELTNLCRRLLESAPDAVKLRTLDVVAVQGPTVAGLSGVLEKLFSESSDRPAWRDRIVVAFAAIGASAFNIGEYVVSQVRADRLMDTKALIQRLKPDLVIGALRSALQGANEPELARALEAIGWLGPNGSEFVPTLTEYSQHINPHVRYSASIALLNVAPASLETFVALKRLMLSGYYTRLIGVELSAAAQGLIQNIASQGSSRIERANAQLVLDRQVSVAPGQ